MKNVTTFGKLLLLFCLPPPPMFKTTTRNELARLGMGTIFLVGERAKRARRYLVEVRDICICYSTGRSDIRDIFHEL